MGRTGSTLAKAFVLQKNGRRWPRSCSASERCAIGWKIVIVDDGVIVDVEGV
jgi:hypothetical protein